MLFLRSALLFLTLWGTGLAYEEIPVTDGGTVSGTVRFEGTPPVIPSIPVIKNPDFCGKAVVDPTLIIHPENHGLKNTLVYLDGVKKGKRLRSGTTVSAFACLFNPHLAVASKGRPVVFYNSDSVLHNPQSFNESGGMIFNVALPNKRQKATRTVAQTGIFRLQCSVHAHMNSYLAILDHPYVSVTDDRGRFRIMDIPPGRYRLMVWHEGFRMINRQEYEASLGKGAVERPRYEEPYILTRDVEVTGLGETRLDLTVRSRD